MKRIFTFLFFVMAVMTASAKVYTDSMSVAMSGSALGKQLASIDLSQQSDGTYQMQITNLVFSGFAIGNITLPGITGTTDDQNVTTYTGGGTATITARHRHGLCQASGWAVLCSKRPMCLSLRLALWETSSI